MEPNSYKFRGAARTQRSFRRAIMRAPRKLRCSVRYLIIMWLCVTSSLANCVVVADEPTFFGVPYCARCEERCGVCPSAAAAHCVPIHAVPMANIELVANPTAGERWNLTIHEAVQIALINSRVVRNLGLQQEQSSDIDKIRAVITRYDPLAAAATADAQWGIFDPVLAVITDWDHQDIPPGTSFAGIGARPPRLDTADFDASLSQLLPTGGQFRTDWVTEYLLNPDHPVTLSPNPQYFSYQQFGVTQPLCQGLGADVTMAPIRIASAKAEQTDWRFKQEILALVRSVETAYWTLYAQQHDLKTVDEVLPMFREIVRIRTQQSRANAGTESEVAQAKADMYLYEQRRLEIMSTIAEQQLVIRDLLGLSLDDHRYMWLVALPEKTPPLESLEDAINTAINRRPDILRQRLAVYVAQQQTIVAGDKMRPHLDFNAFWRINGLGEDVGSSIDSVTDDQYTDWHIGVGFQIPLGRRQAKGNLRAAQFTVEKEQSLLDQVAHQSSYEVADAYRRAIWLSQQLQVADARVGALNQWGVGAKAQFDNPPSGMTTTNALQLYLQNLRDLMDASTQSNAILANLNSALARLEEVKGTLLESESVQVEGDGTDQLPPGLPAPQLQVPDSVSPAPTPRAPAPDTTAPAPKPAPSLEPKAAPKPVTPKEPATPPANSGQGASIVPQKATPPAPSPGMAAKLAEAGNRVGRAVSPVGKRIAESLRWPHKGHDLVPENNQIVKQHPYDSLQLPESVQAIEPQVASRPAPKPVTDTPAQLREETVSQPSDLASAEPVASTINTGEFHSNQQLNSVGTETPIALPPPSDSKWRPNSNPLPSREPAAFPSGPPVAAESTLFQPVDVVSKSEMPAPGANWTNPAQMPRTANLSGSHIQQPDLMPPLSAPAAPVNAFPRSSGERSLVVSQKASAKPAQIRIPDAMLPSTPPDAEVASAQRPNSRPAAGSAAGISPGAEPRVTDSMLPAEASTATRPLWQPNSIR